MGVEDAVKRINVPLKKYFKFQQITFIFFLPYKKYTLSPPQLVIYIYGGMPDSHRKPTLYRCGITPHYSIMVMSSGNRQSARVSRGSPLSCKWVTTKF